MDVHQGKPVLIKSIEISGKLKLLCVFFKGGQSLLLISYNFFFISMPENPQKYVMYNGQNTVKFITIVSLAK